MVVIAQSSSQAGLDCAFSSSGHPAGAVQALLAADVT